MLTLKKSLVGNSFWYKRIFVNNFFCYPTPSLACIYYVIKYLLHTGENCYWVIIFVQIFSLSPLILVTHAQGPGSADAPSGPLLLRGPWALVSSWSGFLRQRLSILGSVLHCWKRFHINCFRLAGRAWRCVFWTWFCWLKQGEWGSKRNPWIWGPRVR